MDKGSNSTTLNGRSSMTPTAESIKIAKRLKELRFNKDLSFERLKNILLEKYGVKISVDSLQNYELTKNHTRANSNLGMRIEYLNYFADLYGVTTDYILGRTDDPSPRPSAVDDLKLSSWSIWTIKSFYSWQNEYFNLPQQIDIFNQMIESTFFFGFMNQLMIVIESMQAHLEDLQEHRNTLASLFIDDDTIDGCDIYNKILEEHPELQNRLYVATGREAIRHQRTQLQHIVLDLADDIIGWRKYLDEISYLDDKE